MKKIDAEKLKKAKALPSVFTLLLIAVLILFAVMLIFWTTVNTLTVGKINQGYVWAEGLYERVSEEGEINPILIEKELSYYSQIIPNITGVIAMKGNEEVISFGTQIPKRLIDEDSLSLSIFFDKEDFANINILIDNSEGTDLVRIREEKWSFLEELDKRINKIMARSKNNDKVSFNMPVLTQDAWYVFYDDYGNQYLIGYKLSISLEELAYGLVSLLGIVLVVLIFLFISIVYIIKSVTTQRKIIKLYYTDIETGGDNWYYFISQAGKLMKKYRKKNINNAIVHIRMDKYRNYCSCYGDKEGEKLIADLYLMMKKNISKKEIMARHDIADFGLLLTFTTEEELSIRVKNMMDMLSKARFDVRINFQAGIYIDGKEKVSIPEAYNMASVARASIVDDHTENICTFNQSMKEELLWEKRVENDMERALSKKEFVVYLQPKYSTSEEKIAAAEALVRWNHPSEGFISPGRFIPIFEENGFILKLDDYMISEVAKLQAKWISEGKKIVPISVNVSRAHFTKEDLAEHICGIIDQYNVPHDSIELELTESAFFDDKNTLITIVNKMKSYGFAVSMDDFGAGYSSLNSLKELPIDVVKLDAEFFRGDDSTGKGKIIVSETINLAKKLDMRIVAEGIEKREQVDFLAGEHCDLIQGYYFAKPLPVEEFEKQAFETDIA